MESNIQLTNTKYIYTDQVIFSNVRYVKYIQYKITEFLEMFQVIRFQDLRISFRTKINTDFYSRFFCEILRDCGNRLVFANSIRLF